MHSIFFQDDNFVGAGRESENIQIKNVQIHGLHANPIEVPSLTTDEGAHMQGVARDLLRITDVSSSILTTAVLAFDSNPCRFSCARLSLIA